MLPSCTAQDSDDPNPLVRALAIRTMSCLRAEKIIDYLSDPLSKALRDDNPYVRKTAAICVAKLYEMKPEMAVEGGFVGTLRDMVGDSNPMVSGCGMSGEWATPLMRFRSQVVANAVTALTDIHQTALEIDPTGKTSMFVIDGAILSKLLIALNECTEWGRIAILSSLARYRTKPGDEGDKEAEHICERVMPQFQHANGSVVLRDRKSVV